jgi:hypothetical protein
MEGFALMPRRKSFCPAFRQADWIDERVGRMRIADRLVTGFTSNISRMG